MKSPQLSCSSVTVVTARAAAQGHIGRASILRYVGLLLILGQGCVATATPLTVSTFGFVEDTLFLDGMGDVVCSTCGPIIDFVTTELVPSATVRATEAIVEYSLDSFNAKPPLHAVVSGSIEVNNALDTGDRVIDVQVYGGDGVLTVADFAQPGISIGTVTYHPPFELAVSFSFDASRAVQAVIDSGYAYVGLRFKARNLQASSEINPSRLPILDLAPATPEAPTAKAGGPYTISLGIKLVLDATASTDPDEGQHEPGAPPDQIISYAWDLSGNNLFTDASGPQPDVTAFFAGKPPGTYPIRLKVTDNTALSFPGSGLRNLSSIDSTSVEVCSSAQPIDGPVAYYPFDENALDESGNGNHGTLWGGASYVDGIRGHAVKFAGLANPGHVHIPNSPSLQFPQNECTFSLWMRLDSFAAMNQLGQAKPYGWDAILAKSHDRSGFVSWINTVNTLGQGIEVAWLNNRLPTNSLPSPGAIVAGVSPDYQLGQWAHIAFSIRPSGASIYWNGILIARSSDPVDLTIANGQDLYFGKFSDKWYPFDGALDEVRIYNRALSACEVQELYRGKAPTPVAPIANAGGPYKFCPGIPLFLDGTGSSNPDEGQHEFAAPPDHITSYAWDLSGNNLFTDAFGAQPDVSAFFTGKPPGIYPIQIKVTDNTVLSFPSSALGNLFSVDSATVEVHGLNDADCSCIPDLVVRCKSAEAQLVWTYTGAHHYNVYRGLASGGPYSKVATTTSTYSTYCDTGLINGTTYFYFVRAASASDHEQCQSKQVSGTPIRPRGR